MGLCTPEEKWRFAYERRAPLFAEALRWARSHADAEDAVADALAAAHRATATEPAQLYAFLRTVVVRSLEKQARANGVQQAFGRLVGTERTVCSDPAGAVCDRYEDSWVLDQLHALPPQYQRALHYAAAGTAVDEWAAAENITVSAAKSRLAHARMAIRKRLAAARAVAVAPVLHLLRKGRRLTPAAVLPALLGGGLLIAPWVGPVWPGRPAGRSVGAAPAGLVSDSRWSSPEGVLTRAQADAGASAAAGAPQPAAALSSRSGRRNEDAPSSVDGRWIATVSDRLPDRASRPAPVDGPTQAADDADTWQHCQAWPVEFCTRPLPNPLS